MRELGRVSTARTRRAWMRVFGLCLILWPVTGDVQAARDQEGSLPPRATYRAIHQGGTDGAGPVDDITPLFVGTLDGCLHALDWDSGRELWDLCGEALLRGTSQGLGEDLVLLPGKTSVYVTEMAQHCVASPGCCPVAFRSTRWQHLHLWRARTPHSS